MPPLRLVEPSSPEFEVRGRTPSRPSVAPTETAPKPVAQALPGGERRHLTVMFCDLAGSTELSTRLDPEDLQDVIRGYQDTVTKVIEEFDGFVAKYMGDGVLVYFGYPRAHEDDAARAVRAALGILEALPELNVAVSADKRIELEVRVGIATGLVVVGDTVGEGTSEEKSVVGDTPNLAARLQALAPSNGIVISPETRHLTGKVFDYQDLGTHELKGFAEPIVAWRVLGESAMDSRREAARPSALTELVGREHELGLLERAWEQSQAGFGQVVLISGEPGIGKSRLVDALGTKLKEEGCIRITLGCSPYHTNSALYPVITHLERVLRWQREDDVETKLAKLEEVLRDSSLTLDEVIPLFAALLSLPLSEGHYLPVKVTPQQQKQQTLDAIVAWLLEEAERRPVLQVWEDLHWADPSTLELLGLEIEQAPTAPILNVLTFRPGFVPPWPQRSHMTPLTLNRLERPEVEALILRLAGGKALPEEVVEHIVGKTDGVPLYVEELTKVILEADFLREKSGHFELTGPLSKISIPATLQDSLMARLDRQPTIREVAQLGSVLGREFAYEMLQPIATMEETNLQKGLELLVDAEMLYQRGRAPKAKYIFKHALVQDAAYQSLLKRTRQQYHRQVAELLEKRFPETVETHPELIAHHYTEAACADQAISNWQKAGQRSIARSANAEAVDHLSRGLALLEGLPEKPELVEQELAMELALGPALVATYGYADPRVRSAYDRAWELCQRIGDSPHAFIVLRGRQLHEMLAGEVPKARDLAEELLGLAERDRNSALLVGGRHALAQTNFYLGEFTAARTHADAGIAGYDRKQHSFLNWPGGHPGEQCYIWSALATWMLGFPGRAHQLVEEAIALASGEESSPFSLANTLAFAALIHVLRREPSSAQARIEASMEICLEQRIPFWLEWGRVVHGWALAAQGQGEEGIDEVCCGLEAFRALGSKGLTALLLTLQAEVFGGLGKPAEALSATSEAFDMMKRNKGPWWEAEL
ncbi:MAG: adenylate/guanylate cyclase domain-containing protein, partial [Acidiferrobacterales bacterium]|nr:adenylate/guanylate cyclase domain-containing protein [Acidiferrobacterales bacterium]